MELTEEEVTLILALRDPEAGPQLRRIRAGAEGAQKEDH